VSKAPIPAEAREISYESFARPVSETAASASNPIFGESGVIRYRVVVGQSGGGLSSTVVEAATGDKAAEAALRKFGMGWKVTHVAPATDEYRSTDDFAAQAA
jgi:hypothetical protein